MAHKHFQCPDCGSLEGYRSRPRNITEKYLLPMLLIQPLRCADCYRRFYSSSFTQARQNRVPPLPDRKAA